jgi:hypothetical protein
MAINPNSLYPTKTAPPSAAYPYGGGQDVTTPGDGTGTPWTAAVISDIWGLLQALLTWVGITPTGTPDAANNSQYLLAAIQSFGTNLQNTTDALTRILGWSESFTSYNYTAPGDGGGAKWTQTGNTVPGSAGTIDWPNGLLYDSVGTEFIYDSPEISFEAFNLQYQAAVDFQVVSGKRIQLQPRTYNLGATTITSQRGLHITGRRVALNDGGTIPEPILVYTGVNRAIDVTAGAAPRYGVVLEGFTIDAQNGSCLKVDDCDNIFLHGMTFIGLLNQSVDLYTCTRARVEFCRFVKITGSTNVAIRVYANTDAELQTVLFDTLGEAWTCIEIAGGSVDTRVANVRYSGSVVSIPIVDNGSGTRFLDSVIFSSRVFTLNGVAQYDGLEAARPGHLARVRIVYPIGTDPAPATVNIGRATAPGVVNFTYFNSVIPPLSAPAWTEDIPIPGSFSAHDLGAGNIIAIQTGGISATGEAHVFVEVTPYRSLI